MGVTCSNCGTDNTQDSEFCKKCGTQFPSPEEVKVTQTIEAPREELTTGSTFAGRYQIIEELGRGGMGRVYKATDTKIKEKVALKLIKPEIASDKKTLERFGNELRIARKIVHKNVGRMFDINEEEGTHYITMEYVSGQDLKGFIRQSGQMAIGTTISVAKQICEGLSEAHKTGVIHRDLKPSNIMIDREGNVRIMDFGIARSLKEKGITGAGVMIGTPEYMSPEQAEAKEVDQRSDIYSLSVILYEMVTGRVPFEGDIALSIAMKHKSEAPKNPKEYNAQVPDDLSKLILKCLEKDKASRFQSAGEIQSELENIEKGIPTTDRAIPKRQPLTSREITVQLSPKKLLVPALVIIAIAIIGIMLWSPWAKKDATLITSDKHSLAVMYFENNTGDESLDHYKKALSDLLITDLSQSKYIKVLRGDKLFNILSHLNQLEAKSYSSDVLKEVAARGNVNHILQGNYTKAGENFRINIILHDTNTDELISSESVEGRGQESIFSMVDELTRKIKANFKLSQEQLASDFDKNIGEITTSSPEAYRYFSEGMSYEFKSDLQEARRAYKRAVEIDPEFALSYDYLAMVTTTMGYFSEAKKYIEKAFELRDKASKREQYIIEGDYYSFFEVYDKAIEAFTRLLQIYPEDWAGNIDLGSLYRDIEQWDKAVERFEFLKQIKDESLYTYTNLSVLYMAKGLYDKSREVIEYFLNNFGEHNAIIQISARNYLCQGKLDLALNEIEKALSNDPTGSGPLVSRGYINLCRGDLKAAEKDFKKLNESAEKNINVWGLWNLMHYYLLKGQFEQASQKSVQAIELEEQIRALTWKARFLRYKAYIYLKTGKYKEALSEIEKAIKIYFEEWGIQQELFLYLKGYIYLEMESMDQAKKIAEELRVLTEKHMNKNITRLYFHLAGLIELKKENISIAIEHFERAVSLLPDQWQMMYEMHALFIESLALAYYKSEDIDKAREEYEKITALTTGRYEYGDIYAKSFYMLGKIYEEQGDTVKAIEHYEKFLDLWKDADPGIAEVDDARERLAELRAE
jgi:serine/threonine protein kinase